MFWHGIIGAKSPEEAGERRMPLWFTVLFLGQVAGLLFSVGLLLITLSSGGAWATLATFLVPASLTGIAILVVAYLPFHVLLSVTHVTNRWAYVAVAFVAFGGFYLLWLDVLLPPTDGVQRDQLSEIFNSPVRSLSYLVPLISIPIGLLFHSLVRQAPLAQPVTARNDFISATWAMGFLVAGGAHALVGLTNSFHIQPDDWRRQISHWVSLGCSCLPLVAGIAAGFARMRSQRASLIIASLAWAAPVILALALLAVISRPRILEYSVARQVFEIPSRDEPRAEPNGFSFNATGRGPFKGKTEINQRLYVSDSSVAPIADSADASIGGATKSIEGDFVVERRTDNKGTLRRIYSLLGADGRTMTRIQCWPGFCYHCFLDGDLRYCLHRGPDAYVQWRDIQQQSINFLAEFHRRT